MKFLHGLVLCGTHTGPEHPLFLWVETGEGDWARLAPQRQHPGCLTLTAVDKELKARVGPLVGAHRGRLEVMLPTVGGRPVPSLGASDATVELRPWFVSGVHPHRSSLLPLMEWLLTIGHRAENLAIAPDLLFLGRLAQWTLHLVASGRVVPDVALGPERTWSRPSARWRLADDPDIADDLERFAQHMPLATAADQRWLHQGWRTTMHEVRLAAIGTFVSALVDQAVRHLVTSDTHKYWGGASRLVERWVVALQSEEAEFHASPPSLRKFMSELDAWHRAGRLLPSIDPMQLVLKLSPQIAGSSLDASVKVPDGWRIEYALRDPKDPGRTLEASTLAGDDPDMAAYRGALYLALVRAGQHFPPLRRSLSEGAMNGCDLTGQEARTFINEAIDKLHAAGVLIQLPAWLERPPASMRTRVVVEVNASGHLSLDTLVAYDWQISIGDRNIDPEQFRQLTEANLPYVQVHGEWIALRPEQIRRLYEIQNRDSPLASIGELVTDSQAWEDDVELSVTGSGVAQFHKLWHALGTERQWELLDAPVGLTAELRPYQQRGFSWLAFMREFGLGACLADDMGLGKTVQVIALLQHVRERAVNGPTLVVCPMSVVENWRREFERFAPNLQVHVHHGADRLYGDELLGVSTQSDVVITSYALALRDADDLGQVAWDTLVADEAQNLKNPGAKQTRAMKSLTAAHRIALTGTPVENRLLELWSIMDFLNPGYLGNMTQFRTTVASPIERHGDEEVLDRFRRRIGPFILRRSKADPDIVPELPEKLEAKVYCSLTAEQAALYQGMVREMMERIESAGGMKRRGLVLASLTRLKQICNHPALYFKESEAVPGRSGKLQRLIAMVHDVLEQDESGLIFTQYAQMGRLLQTTLQKAFDREILLLHGGVPRDQRNTMVQQFQSGEAPLFILSLRAGGVGLNLTRATHVFHFDRWWNPAVENQATDRAYRIGQKNRVNVHKLVCKGTLEDHIDQLIEGKRALAEDVIEAGEVWLSELSNRELRKLFSLQSEAMTR